MKKLFSSLLVAFFAVGMMATGAWAGNIDNQSAFDGMTPITVAAEGGTVLTGTDYDLDSDVNSPLGNATGMPILYEPLVSFNAGDTIRFTLTNGTFEDAVLFMAVDEADIDGAATANNLDGDGNVAEYQIVGQESNRATDDTWVEMTVVAVGGSTWQPSWEIALISSNVDADSGGDPVVELDATAYDYNLHIRPVSTSTDVTIAVTNATYSGGNAVAQTILDLQNQFNFVITTAGTSVIDVGVGSARANFEEEGAADDILTSVNDSDLTAAGALLTYTSAILDDSITLVAADTFTLTLSSDTLSGLDFANNDVFFEVDNAATVNGADVDFADNGDNTATATIVGNTANFVNPGDTNVDDLYIGVDGTTALSPKVFNLAVELEFTTAGYTTRTWTLNTASTWTINGAQFVAPHMISRDGWESYFVVKAASNAITSEMTVDLLDRNGAQATLTSAELPKLALEAGANGGSVFITAADLLGAAGWPIGAVDQDFSATITITLPQSQVFVDGFKYDPAGSTYPISVYENKDLSTSARFIK